MCASKISEEDQERIAENQAYIDKHREALLGNFAPAFCFHKDEDSFPTRPEEYIQDVIMAKYSHYTKNATKLTPEEGHELAIIQKHFITNGEFNLNYDKAPDFHELQDMLAEDGKKPRKERTYDGLLTFDEKKYGYKLGSKVPILGIHPNSQQKKAPIYTAIIPTPDGVRIKYEYFYAISSAIPGTKALYENLPYGVAKKADNFAVHAGD